MYIYGVLKNSDEELMDVKQVFQQVYEGMPDAIKKVEACMCKKNVVYAVVYEKDEAVAAGVLLFRGEDEGLIEQIAVRKEKQGQKYGDMALRMLLANAFQRGIQFVHAFPEPQVSGFFSATGFSKKERGYTIKKQDFIPPCCQK